MKFETLFLNNFDYNIVLPKCTAKFNYLNNCISIFYARKINNRFLLLLFQYGLVFFNIFVYVYKKFL